MRRMHADEVETTPDLVRRLVAAQLPAWGHLPIEPVLPMGTDNALYRLGTDMVVRLPRRPRTVPTLEKERAWLPRLAPHLPLPVPLPLAEGAPGGGYPFTWSVCRWLGGEAMAAAPASDEPRLAADLASFIAALWRLDPTGGPAPGAHNGGRGEPLARRDAATRTAIAALASTRDAPALEAAWDEALTAPAWQGPPVWIHGDLDARNMLVSGGRLSAVIDFGCLGVGDPACDVMVAWKVLSRETRRILRAVLAVDDATWARSRGWALSQAVMALSYYTPETNPTLVREADRWLAEVLGSH